MLTSTSTRLLTCDFLLRSAFKMLFMGASSEIKLEGSELANFAIHAKITFNHF